MDGDRVREVVAKLAPIDTDLTAWLWARSEEHGFRKLPPLCGFLKKIEPQLFVLAR